MNNRNLIYEISTIPFKKIESDLRVLIKKKKQNNIKLITALYVPLEAMQLLSETFFRTTNIL